MRRRGGWKGGKENTTRLLPLRLPAPPPHRPFPFNALYSSFAGRAATRAVGKDGDDLIRGCRIDETSGACGEMEGPPYFVRDEN